MFGGLSQPCNFKLFHLCHFGLKTIAPSHSNTCSAIIHQISNPFSNTFKWNICVKSMLQQYWLNSTSFPYSFKYLLLLDASTNDLIFFFFFKCSGSVLLKFWTCPKVSEKHLTVKKIQNSSCIVCEMLTTTGWCFPYLGFLFFSSSPCFYFSIYLSQSKY